VFDFVKLATYNNFKLYFFKAGWRKRC